MTTTALRRDGTIYRVYRSDFLANTYRDDHLLGTVGRYARGSAPWWWRHPDGTAGISQPTRRAAVGCLVRLAEARAGAAEGAVPPAGTTETGLADITEGDRVAYWRGTHSGWEPAAPVTRVDRLASGAALVFFDRPAGPAQDPFILFGPDSRLAVAVDQ